MGARPARPAELRGADADFREARTCLARSAMEGSRVEAEILDLESSLRRDQRWFEEARQKADRALALYKQNDDAHGVGKMFLQKAKILEESNDLEGAIELLRNPLEWIDPDAEPQLYASARYNLLCGFIHTGRHQEAQEPFGRGEGVVSKRGATARPGTPSLGDAGAEGHVGRAAVRLRGEGDPPRVHGGASSLPAFL